MITNLLGFSFDIILFIYLDILIFKGKTNKLYLSHIADRIKSKLDAWKASRSLESLSYFYCWETSTG